MHIHTIDKQAKYAGATDCTVDIMYRDNSEPTVTAGSEASVGAYTGVIDTQKASIKPALKEDGSVIWEVATTLMMEGESC